MKQILFMIICLLVFFDLQAQIYTGLDTIPGRCPNYYYSEWYDECPMFNTDSANFTPVFYGCGMGILIRENYTPSKLKINGVGAMVDIVTQSMYGICLDTVRLPEYVYLYQWSDTEDSLTLVDSARWDMVTPKLMLLPTVSDSIAQTHPEVSQQYLRCYVYEAYFDKPVYVDSTFFVGGSFNSNIREMVRNDYYYTHLPTEYYTVHSVSIRGGDCPLKYKKFYTLPFRYIPWRYNTFGRDNPFGHFLPIVDNHRVDVFSDDSTMGSVSGSGVFPEPWCDTVRAMPIYGYKFTHWSDGNTDNPRIICPSGDTALTAYFAEAGDCTVTVQSNNEEWGVVEGGGTYPEQQPVTLTAIPVERFIFDHWNDGDWHNPRTFILTQDTTFAAFFIPDPVNVDEADIFGIELLPNPAREQITVASLFVIREVEVFTLTGKLALRQEAGDMATTVDISSLPAGTYMVRIQTTKGTAFKKLVVR